MFQHGSSHFVALAGASTSWVDVDDVGLTCKARQFQSVNQRGFECQRGERNPDDDELAPPDLPRERIERERSVWTSRVLRTMKAGLLPKPSTARVRGLNHSEIL
jgi:hypothetical protein